MESGILGFGIRNTAQGVRNPTNDWNPEFKFPDKNWNPVPGMRNPQREIQNPRLSWISLYGVILNTLKCVLPTSFRVTLVYNYPALCSLYAKPQRF